MSREHAQYIEEAVSQRSEKKFLPRDLAWSQGSPHSVVRGKNKYVKPSQDQLKNALFLSHCSVKIIQRFGLEGTFRGHLVQPKIHTLCSDPSDIRGYSPSKGKPRDEVMRKKHDLLRHPQNRGQIGLRQRVILIKTTLQLGLQQQI